MNTILIVLLTVASVAYLLFRLAAKRKLDKPELDSFNDKFLRNAGKKTGAIDVAKVSGADTLELFRSLLDSEGIETYVIESRMGGLYPLSMIPGFTERTVTVYEEDAEAARQVAADLGQNIELIRREDQ